MWRELRASIVCFVVLTIITGIVYPAVVTGIAQAFFPRQANGSIMTVHGQAMGSELIGQYFDDPKYFWSRPSATADAGGNPLPYNGTGGAGSNLGPSNPAQIQAVRDRIAALQKADPNNTAPVPVELVTASGSGLDPDISVPAAEYQIPRVARVRHLSESRVRQLVEQATEPRTFGLLGAERVNVLKLNLLLDSK